MYKKNISAPTEILIRRDALIFFMNVNNSLGCANVRTSVQFCKQKIAKILFFFEGIPKYIVCIKEQSCNKMICF